MERLLILDLDGTLCLGDAPVLRYARESFASLPPRSAAAASARVAEFLADRGPGVAGARDGYQAVALLARELGVAAEHRERAYRAARAALPEWLDEVLAPPALRRFLGEVRGVRRVLLTNAVETGLDRLLEHLGLADRLDEVVSSAGKPEGLTAALDARGVPASGAEGLASIGDIWVNDLAPVAARGGRTFLIDRHASGEGEPTERASEPDALVPALAAWAHASAM